MNRHVDDPFEIRPAAPRARQHGNQRLVAQVLRKMGGRPAGRMSQRSGAAQGRGQVAAHIAGRGLNANARRVVVKVRLVRAKASSPAAAAAHLRYIERDGVGPHGEPGRAYSRDADTVDLDAFQERGAGDRHQFRMIVSPEDAAALGELRPFVRQWMRMVERDLGVTTDWVAVDHWNTDNPHSHIVLRGKDHLNRDLVIARDYIARGLRERASEVATLWLGPRTELEIQTSRQQEIMQERWTGLDQVLQRAQQGDEVRLARDPVYDALLRGRLQTLTTLGLAEPIGNDTWHLRPGWEATLRSLGERGDIIRTLQRAMSAEAREPAVFDGAAPGQTIVGRIAGKGLVDELSDRGYLAVDALDGRIHYVALPIAHNLADYPLGAVVEARAGGVRAIDEAIARQREGDFYRPDRVRDPDRRIAQLRRLEALRRAGIVERLQDNLWKIPADLAERGRRHDAEHIGEATVSLRCHLTVEQQIRAEGATWLDQQLTTQKSAPPGIGFGAAVRDALGEREQFLVEQGLARRSGQRIVLARNLLAILRERDLTEAARVIQTETGMTYRPAVDGASIQGTYRRSVQLVSGRYALLDDGSGFSLVPWRPLVEKHLGRSLTATVTGHRISWDFSRTRNVER